MCTLPERFFSEKAVRTFTRKKKQPSNIFFEIKQQEKRGEVRTKGKM